MIYLVRHGEAAAGWGTHPDPGLSEAGQQQAAAVAEWLAGQDICEALSSPMQRCRDTASAFGEQTGLSIAIEPAVTEIPTPGEITDWIAWLRGLMSGTWETTPALIQDWRTNLLGKISSLPDQTVVFTHFIAINAIVGALSQRSEVTVFRPYYCSVTTLFNGPGGLKLIEQGEEAASRVL